MGRRRRRGMVGAVIAMAACGVDVASDSPGSDTATEGASLLGPSPPIVTDSAGVRIVASPPDLLEAENWTVDSQAVVVVDGREGGMEPFHLIASMAFDSDSTFVLGEMAMTRLRRYSVDGEFLRSIGRPGQGPGEFGAMNDIVVHRDSLVVWDSRWRRISWFGPDDEFARSVRLQNTVWGFAGSYDGVLDSGDLLAHTGAGQATESTYLVFDGEGAPIRRLDDIPGQRRFPGSARPLGPSGERSDGVEHFAPFPHATTSGANIVRYDGPRYEVEIWDATGSLRSIFRVDTPPRAFTAGMKRSWRDQAVSAAEADGRPQSAIRALRNADLPEFLPSLGSSRNVGGPPRILSDDLGRTWVVEYPGRVRQRWLVWAPDGELAGVVQLPVRFELEAVRGDLLLGVQEDELNVQTAVVYRMRRVTPAG